jgi:prevent-host-death family protein
MVQNVTITRTNVADLKARLSHFLRLAKSGETVIVCERNVPVAELVGLRKPVDRVLRESAFGMYGSWISDDELEEAMRPMTDE